MNDFDVRYRETIERLFQEAVPGFSEAKEFCLGPGKRIRPRLLLDAAEAWGAPREPALQAALGVELLHQYLLVHDDIMDDDMRRRDQPTLYAALLGRYGDIQGRGMTLAIGDHLANEAFALFDERVRRIAEVVIRETILGQLREYAADASWTREQLEEYYAYKTAAYSIRLPWRIADALSGSDPARCEGIERASRALGIAYQFRDDILDQESDASHGKTTITTLMSRDEVERMIQELVVSAQDFFDRVGLADTGSVAALKKFLTPAKAS